MLSKNMADLDTVSPVVWPKWCYSSNPENEPSVPHVISKVPTASLNKARRKKVAGRTAIVKNERCSPAPSADSPLSDSPNSPGSSSFVRTPASSFGTGSTRPNSSFTPPDRFSPGNFNNNGSKLIMEGLHMSRNYSDFMRSLAAKYNNNNNNNNNNNGGGQQADFRANSFLPLLDSRFSSYKGLLAGPAAGGASPFPNLLSNLPVGPLAPAVVAAKKDLENSKKEAALQQHHQQHQPLSHLSGLMAAGSQHLPAAAAGLSTFPMMMDMSSTQALLNIVRSASAQNAQQLESYLRVASTTNNNNNNSGGSSKRSAESAGLSSPLDLSASMVKRPSPYLMEPPRPVPASSKSPLQYSPTGKKSPSSRSTPTEAKRVTTPSRPPTSSSNNIACRLPCAADSCTPAAIQVRGWSVSEVVDFVKSIDLCAEYAQVFREHSIDGSTLPLLTEEHLTGNMNMKLGPALKLRSVLANKIGHCAVCLHCVHCHHQSESTSTAPTAAASSPPAASSPTAADQQNPQTVAE